MDVILLCFLVFFIPLSFLLSRLGFVLAPVAAE